MASPVATLWWWSLIFLWGGVVASASLRQWHALHFPVICSMTARDGSERAAWSGGGGIGSKILGGTCKSWLWGIAGWDWSKWVKYAMWSEDLHGPMQGWSQMSTAWKVWGASSAAVQYQELIAIGVTVLVLLLVLVAKATGSPAVPPQRQRDFDSLLWLWYIPMLIPIDSGHIFNINSDDIVIALHKPGNQRSQGCYVPPQ
ncbi:hypothetical protein F5148DRAFT_1151565 [Russula earlei]|uniref:Uncharacterized protein n=1 Tax=Russula earlei TaxID=71964 RepID=A0ACC0U142_9AGAM|nr:hypothetical protein F5148DRAFT_1151565 [Russula earlei]